MTKLEINQILTIQLDILTAIHQFCCKNEINYSLACGTLLGARRHQGYIPWDDDIDIYLLREDYDKLISSFPETYKGLYKIASLERDPKWDRAYAKAYHCKTIFKEAISSNYPLGICIDIFPIDSVPKSPDEWRKYNRKRLFVQNLFSLKCMTLSNDRSLIKNLILLMSKVLLLPWSRRYIAKRISQIAQCYNGTDSDLVFENVLGIIAKRPFPKRFFLSMVDIRFENRIFRAFADADKYLEHTYGDWHKLPPEEKRITHHAFEAYLK